MKSPIACLLVASILPIIDCHGQTRVPAGPTEKAKPSPARSALETLEFVRTQSRKPITKIVTLSGTHGLPTPTKWEMIFHDPASSTQLSEWRTGAQAIPGEESYANGEVPVYFSTARFKIDSQSAFEKANTEAASAKVGFDWIDYKLHGVHGSDEPLWTLHLINKEKEVVGVVILSAETGKVLRTVWLRHSARGGLRVIDSALSPTGTRGASKGASDSTESDLRALPRNPDPAPGPDPDQSP